MDYAIFKTTDGKDLHPVHRFTQEATGHRAKKAAREKLQALWLRVLSYPCFLNADGCKPDEFSYDHPTSTRTSERIRFFIAPIKG